MSYIPDSPEQVQRTFAGWRSEANRLRGLWREARDQYPRQFPESSCWWIGRIDRVVELLRRRVIDGSHEWWEMSEKYLTTKWLEAGSAGIGARNYVCERLKASCRKVEDALLQLQFLACDAHGGLKETPRSES